VRKQKLPGPHPTQHPEQQVSPQHSLPSATHVIVGTTGAAVGAIGAGIGTTGAILGTTGAIVGATGATGAAVGATGANVGGMEGCFAGKIDGGAHTTNPRTWTHVSPLAQHFVSQGS
jgi:hypothetical protein